MQFCLLILRLLSGIALGSESNGGKHWAVLVAGSNGWGDYRHHVNTTLKTGAENTVFVFFTDHGSPNMILFPNGKLHADQFIETLVYMNKARMYKKLVLYVEACFSGSMFQRILPKNIDICPHLVCLATFQVPEVSKEVVKLDYLCQQGYDANVVVQAIFTAFG
ncbi:Legumain [Fasciola hepatica]|uniref:Legumain n=1 Tax=Fasciola hepatica TaxID=6192 RepID=A0A4E0RDR2_FASHE|nr:Legumain [Fasciola hepatica]